MNEKYRQNVSRMTRLSASSADSHNKSDLIQQQLRNHLVNNSCDVSLSAVYFSKCCIFLHFFRIY